MKKTLIALLTLASVGASAVTLSWNANGSAASIFGLTAGTPMSTSGETASITIYYLLYSDYDTINALGKVKASEIASFAVATATGNTSENASAAGRVKASTSTTAFTTAGNEFYARAYATFDSKTYFIDLFGGAGTGGVWSNTLAGDESTPEKLSWSNGSYGGSTSTTVGTKNSWVAVPEPSTAMLALAGLALLIKRRRA